MPAAPSGTPNEDDALRTGIYTLRAKVQASEQALGGWETRYPAMEAAAPAGYNASRMTEEWFDLAADPAHVARQREKARALRKTAWWRRRIQRGICAYCGRTVPPATLTMDHIVPVARGGQSAKGNVVAACKECNTRKRLMTPAEQLMMKPLHPPGED